MTHPLQLSPSYAKLKNTPTKIATLVRKKTDTQKSKRKNPDKKNEYINSMGSGMNRNYFYDMNSNNETKYRFVRFHGKGDLSLGLMYYKRYWDQLDEEAKQIINSQHLQRKKSHFARYINIDPTILSQYGRKEKANKKFWKRMLTMRKIVKGFDGFIEKERK